LFKLVLFLLLGAILNIAVAWGFVLLWTSELTSRHYPHMGYVHSTVVRPGRTDDPHGLIAAVQVLAGWPTLCLRHDETITRLDLPIPYLPLPLTEKVLPYRPIWPGFAINTIFYATILWLPFAPFQLRRYVRVKRGRCIKCGYDLSHVEHKACPECGVEV